MPTAKRRRLEFPESEDFLAFEQGGEGWRRRDPSRSPLVERAQARQTPPASVQLDVERASEIGLRLGRRAPIADRVGVRRAGASAVAGRRVLVPQTGAGEAPRLGSHLIPVVTEAEKACVSNSWIASAHPYGGYGTTAVAEALQ